MSSASNEPVERTSEDSPVVQSISVLEPSVRPESSLLISTAAYFDPFSSQGSYSQGQLYNNQMYNDPFYDQPNEYSVPPTQQYYQHQLSGSGNCGVPSAVPWTTTAQYYNTPSNYDHPPLDSSYGGRGHMQFSNSHNCSVTPYWHWSAQSLPYASVTMAASTTNTNFNSDDWNSNHAPQPSDLETVETTPCSNQSEIMDSDNNSQLSNSTKQSSSNDKNYSHTSPVCDYRQEMSENSISSLKNVKSKSDDNLGRSPEKQCAISPSYRRESNKSSTKFVVTMNDQHSDILRLRTGLSKKKHVKNTSDQSIESEGKGEFPKIDVAANKKNKKLDTFQEKLVQQKLARVLTSLKTCFRAERRELLIQKIELNLELNKLLSTKLDSRCYGLGKKRKKNIRRDLEAVYHFLKTCSNIKERLRLKYIQRALIQEFCSELKPSSRNKDDEKLAPYSPRSNQRDTALLTTKAKSKEMRYKESCQRSEEPIPLMEKKIPRDCELPHRSISLVSECVIHEDINACSAKHCSKVLEVLSTEKEISHEELHQPNEESTPASQKSTDCERFDELQSLRAKILEELSAEESHGESIFATKKIARDCLLSHKSQTVSSKSKKKRKLDACNIKGQKKKDAKVLSKKSESDKRRQKKLSQQNEEVIIKTKRKMSLENGIIRDIRTENPQRNIPEQLEENHSSADNFQQHHSNGGTIEQYPDFQLQKYVPSSIQPLPDKCRENEKYLSSQMKVGITKRKDLREIIEARRKKFGPRKKIVDDGKKWTSFWKRKEEVESRHTDSDEVLEQADDCVLVPAVIPEVDLLDCETSEEDTIANESNITMKPIWAIKVESESSDDESNNVEVPTTSSQTVPNAEDESHLQANVLSTEESRFLPVEMLELESLQDTESSSYFEEKCNDTAETEARTTTSNKDHQSATITLSNSEINSLAPVEDEFHSPSICTLSNGGSSSLSVEMLELECSQDIEVQSDLEEQLGNTMENKVRTIALIDEDTYSIAQGVDSRLAEDQCFSQVCAVNIEEETQSAEICRLESQLLQSSLPNIYPEDLASESHKNEESTKNCNTATFDITSISSRSDENLALDKKKGMMNVEPITAPIADGKYDCDGFCDDQVNITSISHHVILATNDCEVNMNAVLKTDDNAKNIDLIHSQGIASTSRYEVDFNACEVTH